MPITVNGRKAVLINIENKSNKGFWWRIHKSKDDTGSGTLIKAGAKQQYRAWQGEPALFNLGGTSTKIACTIAFDTSKDIKVVFDGKTLTVDGEITLITKCPWEVAATKVIGSDDSEEFSSALKSIVEGGPGIDRIVYPMSIGEYAVGIKGDKLIVDDDELHGVEVIVFGDGPYAFSPAGKLLAGLNEGMGVVYFGSAPTQGYTEEQLKEAVDKAVEEATAAAQKQAEEYKGLFVVDAKKYENIQNVSEALKSAANATAHAAKLTDDYVDQNGGDPKLSKITEKLKNATQIQGKVATQLDDLVDSQAS